MHTNFLGREEIVAYLREFAERLLAMSAPPLVWCPIGGSGNALARELLRVVDPAILEKVRIVKVAYDRQTDKIAFEGTDPKADIKGQGVLVIDSAIHSGDTMRRIVQEIYAFGPMGVCTYGLVVKNSAKFIPSYWAVLIEDHDRAFFLLDELPTQRLTVNDPYLHLRKLRQDDLGLPPVKSTVASMDRQTWDDRYFDTVTSQGSQCTYLLETVGGVVGYLTVELKKTGDLLVHEVAVGEGNKGKDFGAALMRWAETMARNAQCEGIGLWAIDKALNFYKKLGYEEIPKRHVRLANGENYLQMRKAVLQHL